VLPVWEQSKESVDEADPRIFSPGSEQFLGLVHIPFFDSKYMQDF